MEITEIEKGSPLYNQALQLRYELFFKDFDLPKSVTADDLEDGSVHLVLTNSNELLAYGRLSPLGGNIYRISQIVVNPGQRREGHATRIVTALIFQARKLNATEIVLNSQVSVMSLYKRLGFIEFGDIYNVKLTGVPHQKMRYMCD